FNVLTRLRIVWINAFKLDITSNNYPFPLDDTDLEHRTRHSYRLASCWLADSPLTPKSETTFIGSPVSEINFVPGRQLKWLLAVSKGIWLVLTIWDVAGGHKCSQWSPKGTIFTELKLNAESRLTYVGHRESFSCAWTTTGHWMRSVLLTATSAQSTSLVTRDIISLSDDVSKMLIYNWKTKERAYIDDVGDSQHDNCLEVVFTPSTILVVRARSITLYGISLTRIDTHSFGWVDGASATPISILICSQHDNPWASKLNSLELYSLSSFPPTLSRKVSSRSGALRCTNVILGKGDTAVWICPHDRAMVSHGEKHDGYETLIAAVFPGPLNPSTEVHVREVCMNSLNNWTVLDYDEELGRIGLGSGFGKITIVQL
ncbi:hypothetical protein EV421DRAFT_1718159, partial [Armillaria borealis]